MRRYILRRLLLVAPVVLGAMTGVFLLVHLLPGDAALFVAGERARPETVEAVRRHLGLDQPLHVQYLRYLTRLIHGDMGDSAVTGTPVAEEMRHAFPNTVSLALAAVAWSVPLGVVLGVMSAGRRGSLADRAAMSGAVFGLSFPGFFISLMALYFFAFRLGWFPIGGRGPALYTWQGAQYLVLPALSLGLPLLAEVARMTRSTVLEVLGADYVRTARAKGMGELRVMYRHALQNALLPVITLIGVGFARLLSGAVVVETVFAWPGMGRLVIAAILVQDLPLVQGVLLLKASAAVFLNLLVDVAYGLIDPRVRYA